MNEYNGILLVNKPKDWTSQDVLSKIKRHLHVDKIGHVGTLDPLATGLLVVLVGSATKLSDYLMTDEKEYECEILIGKSTDTEDITGELIEEKEVNKIENIDDVLNSLVGTLEQIPPMYSSIKVNGVKLYELARMGMEIERKSRIIEIKNIVRTSELQYKDGYCSFKFKTNVSKGTYIRTLCVEIGKRLGYPALMKELCRTQSGNFYLENSYTLQEVLDNKFTLLSNYDAIKGKDTVEIYGKYLTRVLNGMKIRVNSDKDVIYLVNEGKLLGIYEKDNDGYKAKRVWN